MKKLLYFFIFTAVIALPVFNIAADTIVTDGLVSYWTFDLHNIKDRIAEDVWGENDATIMGNPEIVGGRVKQALKFDGIDDFVNLTDLGDFGEQIGSSTFEAWIKVGSKVEWQSLVKVIDKRCVGWGIDLNWNVGERRFLHFPLNHPLLGLNGSILSKSDIRISSYISRPKDRICFGHILGQQTSRDEKWHHILFVNETKNKQRSIQLYLDGKLLRSYNNLENQEEFLPFAEPVYLGAGNNRGNTGHFFEGVIDEVRIYDRALADDEVIRNFESGNPLNVEPAYKLPTIWGTLKRR